MKPIDFGADGVNGCLDKQGRIVALNLYHAQHGYVTLTTADPFPDALRYDQAAVRAYRSSFAMLDGFGILPQAPIRDCTTIHGEGMLPQTTLMLNDGRVLVGETLVDQAITYQRWCWGDATGEAQFVGRLSLQRCAYTQLTEGGVIPAPAVESRVSFRAIGVDHGAVATWTIENPALPAAVCIAAPFLGESYTQETTGTVIIDLALRDTTLILCLATGRDADDARARALAAYPRNSDVFDAIAARQRAEWYTVYTPTIDAPPWDAKALAYTLAMAIPVRDGVCFLTDHMLLPLSWNRDAYYLAWALLRLAEERAARGLPPYDRLFDLVERHLIWMFEIAERSDGAWGRCYLANGRLKDPAFQLDQQLFPLLELAEYVIASGDTAICQRLEPHVKAVLAMLASRRADIGALFATDETPGDDPVTQPYHLSSHILFWRTLKQLAHLGIDTGTLADDIRAAVDAHFIVDREGERLYAYTTDGRGDHLLYHDANDFPTVIAPLWGWCEASDPVWRATMAFAFSDANREAWFDQHLGSVHTRAAWVLGDLQALTLADILGDADGVQAAMAALFAAMQPDGSFCEAYNPQTGAVVSRHWFAWPLATWHCVRTLQTAPLLI